MIGYVMVIYDYDEEAYNIWHMMIDKAYQGRGYGKAAMQRVLSYIASKPFGNSNHAPLSGDYIQSGVGSGVSYMKAMPRGIRELYQGIELGH